MNYSDLAQVLKSHKRRMVSVPQGADIHPAMKQALTRIAESDYDILVMDLAILVLSNEPGFDKEKFLIDCEVVR